MTELAGFARGVVHDLRNPLNVVEMNLYLLRQRLAEDPRALRLIQRISDQVPAIAQLLNGYLAFDLVTHPTLQRVRLNEVARSVVESTSVPEGTDLLTEFQEDLPLIDADPQLLEAALRALIRNSIRAMRTGGQLRVVTQRSHEGVQLVVEDTGPGIPEEVLPHVYEPFFTTWEEHAGIGLPLVAKVARIHGGQTSLSTKPGAGTRVELTFPVHG